MPGLDVCFSRWLSARMAAGMSGAMVYGSRNHRGGIHAVAVTALVTAGADTAGADMPADCVYGAQGPRRFAPCLCGVQSDAQHERNLAKDRVFNGIAN